MGDYLRKLAEVFHENGNEAGTFKLETNRGNKTKKKISLT